MKTWEEFKDEYDKESLGGLTPELVYETYYAGIRPYLQVIADFKAQDKPASDKQIRLALGVSPKVWGVCKKVFKEFEEFLSVKESFMDLKAQIDVQRGLLATEFKNPKILEMQSIRYDKGYKPKGGEVEINYPKTLEIKVREASMDDEALKDFEPDLKSE